MKGMELSRLYYEQVIRLFLDEQVPELAGRIAVGLVGDGSECFGYDDELSRDHDWGARVCLWLNSADYQRFGGLLERELIGLPTQFQGYPVCHIPGRDGVLDISAFFKRYLLKGTAPETFGYISYHYFCWPNTKSGRQNTLRFVIYWMLVSTRTLRYHHCTLPYS